jgi:hypothetical protein
MARDTGEATDELSQDNQRRVIDLNTKGLQVAGLDVLYLTVLVEHIFEHMGDIEALAAARLDYEGRVSNLLDNAEKQASRAVLLQPPTKGLS